MGSGGTTNTKAWFQRLTPIFGAGTLLARRETNLVLIAGEVKDLIAVVYTAAGVQFTASTSAIIRLEQDGDTDDGKYWDNDSWEVAATLSATATHLEAGQHLYQLPADATSGRAGATIHFTFTDNLTEASATTVCTGGEHEVRIESLETSVAAGKQIRLWNG